MNVGKTSLVSILYALLGNMITINSKVYKELRCSKCQKFIVYQNVAAGVLCYICPRCEHLNEFVFKYLKNDENEEMMKKKYQVEPKKENNI
jgi:phage FluMu protein Com